MRVIKKRHKNKNIFISKYPYQIVFNDKENKLLDDNFYEYFNSIWGKCFTNSWAFSLKRIRHKKSKNIYGGIIYEYEKQYSLYIDNLDKMHEIKKYILSKKILS